MKRPARMLVALLLCALFIRFGNSCAYAPEVDVFTLRTGPDAPYAQYAAGRLGIVPGSYRIRHLVVAYRTLSGRGLSPAEQEAAVSVDEYYNGSGPLAPNNPNPAWQTAGPRYDVASSSPQLWSTGYGPVERLLPGQQFESFNNCLADAFANAAATLADRRARYGKPGGPDTPEIADWIAGQQAVFSNCGDTGQTPKAVAADAPIWLRQDRAYQTAAAAFYNLDYDRALAGFQAIAADHASPWSPLARYLVARVYIRKALVGHDLSAVKPEALAGEQAQVRTLLAQAQAQLAGILRDPGMQSLHRQAGRLLDFAMLRLEPAQQAAELARRLTGGGDPDYAQNVIDLSYLYNSSSGDAIAAGDKSSPELLRWLDDWRLTSAADAAAGRRDALRNWRRTKGPEWLAAALNLSQPGDDGVPELSAAARTLAAGSPAYASVTYQRLRLEASPSAYTELAELMPRITETQPISTVNQFADLQSSLSPTLNDYLQNATRHAAGLSRYDDKIEPLWEPVDKVALCGVDIYAPDTRHLDEETASIFNQRLPLRLLKEAALSSALPPNVRFQVAHMAWTRALLLDDAETARALSPYLSRCQPAFAPWLEAYDAAPTADERHVLGLLALMRFASTEPTVRAGLERDFAAYDEFRNNWWCSVSPATPPDGGSYLFTQPMVARNVQPDPPFLSAADRKQVDEELGRLEKIPFASDYFARQALAWVDEHPGDGHNADLIGFAMRVVRNACRSDKTKDLNHQLFDMLHSRYPKSEWAARYTTWE